MIKYLFYQKNPASHYVYIDMEFEVASDDNIQIQLPSWRPGRYELGNFAKNIKKLEAFGKDGKSLSIRKLTKDLWEIDCVNTENVKITYSYYAAELNAGACYADTEQLYINPIHCCFSVIGKENKEHQITLNIPTEYKIATSLDKKGNVLIAKNFEELVDSPFIASASILTDTYEEYSTKFYLHFVGNCKPDFNEIKADFKKFTAYLYNFWGDFPFPEYHFLFQITPQKFYHGVEHLKNTVIALGPGYALHDKNVYEDLLGVSCHELFHAWNIKTIRPKEMLPYNYTKENYANTGFVYEGFTTYYGDKHLLCSNVFSTEQYLITLEERLDKHFHNYGRYNLSVADSSWDTWLDGYMPGAPYRKTNIYDEGSLIAFMLDIKMMQATANKKSLKDVCRKLYNDFGKKRKGYSFQDIVNLVNEISEKELTAFFEKYVLNAADFEEELAPCFNYIGWNLEKIESLLMNENKFGFKTIDNGQFAKVALVAPYSPAWKCGIFNNDDIIGVNGTIVRNNLSQLLNYYVNEPVISLQVVSNDKIKTLELQQDNYEKTWFFKSKIKPIEMQTELQKQALKTWLTN